VVIRFFASIRNITGVKEIKWGELTPTLGELLRLLSERYGPQFRRWVLDDERMGNSVLVLVNGEDVRHGAGLCTPLHPEDVVSILPMMVGGSLGQGGAGEVLVPFDAKKLSCLMGEAGLRLVLAAHGTTSGTSRAAITTISSPACRGLGGHWASALRGQQRRQVARTSSWRRAGSTRRRVALALPSVCQGVSL
jgi:sulfur-carrier protein